MSSKGPFGLLRGPLQMLRESPYVLTGSLRSQEVSESFQRVPKYFLKLTDHSFGHSKGSFGNRKRPFEAQGWGHGPLAPFGSATAPQWKI